MNTLSLEKNDSPSATLGFFIIYSELFQTGKRCFPKIVVTLQKTYILNLTMFKQMPPITKNLLIINLIVFLTQLVGQQRGLDLTELFGLHFFLADDFHIYQLVTYLFLHADFSHIFFNMFSLWMFGRIIEQTMGYKRFLLYYFVCGIGAGICQEFWQLGEYLVLGFNHYEWVNTGSETLKNLIPMGEALNMWTTIGASGACYGVLLAFGMTFPNERIMLLIPPIPLKAKYFIVGYAAIELFSAFFTNGNTAHFAHLGGMLFGLLLILYWRKQDRKTTNFQGWDTWRPQNNKNFMNKLKEKCKKIFERKPKMTVNQGGKRFKDRDADYDYNMKNKEKQENIDKILEKIRRSGYESLTADEKRELFNNSRK